MSDLRTRLIRLAHSNPELRPHVLPLVAERTAAKGYNAEEAAWLFNWLTKKVVQAVRPYKLPVKAEVVSHGDRGFEGVIRIGDDPPDRQPFDRNSSMHLTVNPVKVGSGRPDLVRYNVELLNGDGKSFEVQTDYELDEFKRQSARAIMENLAIILSSNDKVEREWLTEQAMGRTAAWENLPEGWTEESVQSFWDSLTGDVKHKITKCMKQMEGKVTDTGAFCGSLASQVGYRAASAGTLDATTVRRAAIRVAHEDASTRGVILASMPVAAAKLPVASLAKMMAERVGRGYADEVSLVSGRFVIYEWAAANNLEINRSTADALIEALLETAVTWGKPKVDVGAMTKVLQQYASRIVPKKGP